MAKKRISKLVMKKMLELRDSIEADNIPVNQMYLYGSFAKGNAHAWSDVDICVVSTAFGTKIKDPINYLWSKRLVLRDFTIEPVGFSQRDFKEGSPLIAEIKKYGIKLPLRD